MIDAQIKADIKAAEKALGALKKQVPYAAWLAQKNTAFAVRNVEMNHMKRVFKTTARYTLQAVLVDYQNYSDWRTGVKKEVAVDVLSQFTGRAGNRTRSRHYLWDHIHGQRTHSGFEKLLIDAGIMPRGYFAVRTKYLDLYTQGRKISKGIYNSIASQLKAFKPNQGHDINATDSRKSKRKRSRGAGRVFYVMTLNGTYGIWMHHKQFTGSGAVPIFFFVKSTNYQKIFKFYEVAERAAPIYWRREFPKAIRRALDTAR